MSCERVHNRSNYEEKAGSMVSGPNKVQVLYHVICACVPEEERIMLDARAFGVYFQTHKETINVVDWGGLT